MVAGPLRRFPRTLTRQQWRVSGALLLAFFAISCATTSSWWLIFVHQRQVGPAVGVVIYCLSLLGLVSLPLKLGSAAAVPSEITGRAALSSLAGIWLAVSLLPPRSAPTAT